MMARRTWPQDYSALLCARFLVCVLSALIVEACAEPSATKLRVASWLPPSHVLVRDILVPWAERVRVATDGRVEIEVMSAPLGQPSASFDIARDGLADIAYGVHTYTPGRFVLSEVAELPFLSDSSEALSVAFWRVQDEHLSEANEHRGVRLLGVWTHGPSHIFTREGPIRTMADFEGLKMRVGGGLASDIAEALGTVSVATPATKAYETLANGVADGLFFPAESVPFFNLTKLLPHATLVPGGLFNASFFLVMNQESWNALSSGDQNILMEVSGESLARLAGKAWDAEDERAFDAMRASGAHLEIVDDDLLTELRERLTFLEERWLDEANERGIDAEAVLEALRQEIAEH